MTSLLCALFLAALVPALGYLLLRRFLNGFDAAAIAATYGSVSAVTFITAVQYLDNHGIAFGGHMAAAMALMESPAIIMAVVVIGLMSAVGPALWNEPLKLAGVLALSAAMNFGLQAGAFAALRNTGAARVAYAIVAGNRNMGLFLAVLPSDLIDNILLFLGCYQISMYLTPILMRRLYK